MSPVAPDAGSPEPPTIRRWAEFDRLFNERIRASDAAWAATLDPTARIAIVEELFATAHRVRDTAGDWENIDARAWVETLAERRRFVASFSAYGEVSDGRATVADAG